jgi:hypothetical protein
MTRNHRKTTTANTPAAPANCHSSVVKSLPPDAGHTNAALPAQALPVLSSIARSAAVKVLTGPPGEARPALALHYSRVHYNVPLGGWQALMTDASVFGQGRGGEVLVEDQIRLPTLVDIFELLSREEIEKINWRHLNTSVDERDLLHADGPVRDALRTAEGGGGASTEPPPKGASSP